MHGLEAGAAVRIPRERIDAEQGVHGFVWADLCFGLHHDVFGCIRIVLLFANMAHEAGLSMFRFALSTS